MQYYFAPLEGMTDSIYRRVHQHYFPGIDCYYMPFLSPTIHQTLSHKEKRELPAASAVPFRAVPQVLTKVPTDFLWAAEQCAALGYDEVNLNIGCPSGTVVAKGKGAGMLADMQALDTFLDGIFSKAPLAISIKTRLGMESSDEFPAILAVLNQYPVKEIIIHPRVRKAFYNGSVDMQAFDAACAASRVPICYNGNLCTIDQIHHFTESHPSIHSVMLGRGLIGDPGMLCEGGTDIKSLEAMYETLLEEYLLAFGGSRNAMFRLKENWRYLICRFQGGEKLYKQLRKTTDLAQYRSITAQIFHTLPLAPQLQPDW